MAAACFCLQSAGVFLLWRSRSPALLACYVVLYGYASWSPAGLLVLILLVLLLTGGVNL